VSAVEAVHAPRARSLLARVWFGALLASICFEGLGRKYLPDVPSVVLYFLKDAVLVAGIAAFGIRREVAGASRRYLGGFVVVVVAAFAWTVMEVFNPEQAHLGLAVVGLRSYWLWWLAPLVVASALESAAERRVALPALVVVTAVVVGYAAVQFAAPPDGAVNTYALFEGESMAKVATVGTTGRARVSSTFSYIAGFTDFLVLLPALLLALGLGAPTRTARAAAVAAAAVAAASIPMAGSRAPLVLAAAGLGLVGWGAGFVSTRPGRRVLLGAAAAAAIALVAMPVAVEGVRDRFGGEDTRARVVEALQILPPIALVSNDYPLLGDGTGMQQNARLAFGVASRWDTESETSRLLAELGPFGYLLVWTTKLGLAVALLRVHATLRRVGRRPLAGGALAFAFFAVVGNAAFDHVWQALFFVGVGLLLGAAMDARREGAA
jgi:hypothetical protein